ncbi:DUF6767 domain-containing protein [Cutibacterium sp. V947]|uniref:DUF6767 domain-containing protein n=1 Tax=unclassified Cutibacterium TaxID=2649671 RepID=UPI003EE0C3CA
MADPVPMCPLRPGDPCSLCQLYVTGPQDCGLVYLVMGDDALRGELARYRKAAREREKQTTPPRAVEAAGDGELCSDSEGLG